MKAKTKKGIKYTLLSALVALVGTVTIAASNPDFALGRNIQILFNMFRELNLLYVDQIDPDEMLLDAADGMTSKLDPYTELIPEKEMADFEIMTTGKYGGMGAMIRQKDDYVMIAQPYKNSPADKAGLVVGDLLLEVNGESIKGYEVSKVSSMLKGTPGTTLHLKVRKLLTGQEEELTFKRERIVVSGIPYWSVIDDSIGYIVHKDFSEDCSNDIRNAVMSMKKAGIKGLIIDLRGNGGGILQEAVKILSMFVPKGTEVVSMRGRMKELDATFVTQSEPIDTQIPVAVLINSSSASAAEIVAGAFQDLDRGVLLGQRSFGKGLVQSTRPVGYNAYLKLTTAKYYTPSGRCIQAIDYSHRAEDGSVGTVPDSLIKEYTTKAGRKVYDGGGVMPDIRTDPEYISRFAMTLYTLGFIEDFGDEYMRRNPGREIDVRTFSITDRDYADFAEFMKGKKVPYESDTRRALKVLKKAAEDDRFAELKNKFEQVEAELKDDTQTNLETYRKQVVEAINNDIVMRYGYQAGVIEHSLPGDKEVKQAIGVLENPEEYARITREQDTQRK